MAEKVVLGLSGGMDSAYAAIKLLEMGYELVGVNIVMRDNCDCSDKAERLSKLLGIEFCVFDARDSFERNVIKPFADAYVNGLTPNPCVLCNPAVKLKQLFLAAERYGAKYVATGHYSVPVEIGGRYSFAKAKDEKKDQGYFLYGLSQVMISRLIFPLGNVLKSEIKDFFRTNTRYLIESNIESTDICFVENGRYADVVAEYRALPPKGKFVDKNGAVLGEHNGIHNYTVGQRKGLGIALGVPAYVCSIDPVSNTVMLSFDVDERQKRFKISRPNYLMCERVEEGSAFFVRTRYRSKPLRCIVNKVLDGYIEVEFCDETATAAPGQSAVFYDENGYIAFGGIIIR